MRPFLRSPGRSAQRESSESLEELLQQLLIGVAQFGSLGSKALGQGPVMACKVVVGQVESPEGGLGWVSQARGPRQGSHCCSFLQGKVTCYYNQVIVALAIPINYVEYLSKTDARFTRREEKKRNSSHPSFWHGESIQGLETTGGWEKQASLAVFFSFSCP